ncbi:MAG: PEP-utilizing enzyme [Actinomycetota bacterium]
MRWWPGARARRRMESRPIGTMAIGAGLPDAHTMGTRIASLDRARRRGVRVPESFAVPAQASSSVFAATWALEHRITTVLVRAAFHSDDDESQWIDLRRTVPVDGISDAIAEIRAASPDLDDDVRRHVLVSAAITATCSGRALTEPGRAHDLAECVGLDDDDHSVDITHLPRLGRASRGWARRLQRSLRRTRAVFGDVPLHIDWADDGSTCWVLDVRPVTPPPRNEALTLAGQGHLPPLPSALAVDVMAEVGARLLDRSTGIGATVGDERPLIHVVAGRPFINQSLVDDLHRRLGLPSIAGAPSDTPRPDGPGASLPAPPRLRVRRLLVMTPVLALVAFGVARGIVRAGANRQRVRSLGTVIAVDFRAAVSQLADINLASLRGSIPLGVASRILLAVLRRTRTLEQHQASHRPLAAQLTEQLAAIDSDDAQVMFLRRFGHRGPFEGDVARARYVDDESLLVVGRPAPNTAGPDSTTTPGWFTRLRVQLTTPIWVAARWLIDREEQLEDELVRATARCRTRLVDLATEAVERQRLREVDDLWLLRASEIRRLDDGWNPPAALWAERADERRALAALAVPPTATLFDDPMGWSLAYDGPRSTLRGVPSAGAAVAGRAWVAAAPTTSAPWDVGEPPVLVVRALGPEWIATASLAAAVIAEEGTALDPATLLFRSHGCPVVVGAAGAGRVLATGDRVEVRAATGSIDWRPVATTAAADTGDVEHVG